MNAMPLALANLPNAQRSDPPRKPAAFQPLDPAILNASIPAFYIGRNSDGFWLARDVLGKNGGAFLLKSSALAFARRCSQPGGCAIILATEPFELDLDNRGNPFVAGLRRVKRLAAALAAVLGTRSNAH
jgi:hypothetical protein